MHDLLSKHIAFIKYPLGSRVSGPQLFRSEMRMDVYSFRRSATRYLHKDLPSTTLVVPAPDHPLLSRGPDLLVGSENGLAAFFVSHATERRSLGLLRSRLILSRLAFPIETRFIFIATSKDIDIERVFARDFSAIVSVRERDAIVNLAARPRKVAQQDVPESLHSEAKARFAHIYSITSKSYEIFTEKNLAVGQQRRARFETEADAGAVPIRRYSSGLLGLKQIDGLIEIGAADHLNSTMEFLIRLTRLVDWLWLKTFRFNGAIQT